MKSSGKTGSLLVTVGSLANAFAKWFLVWVFARAGGGVEAVGLYSLVLAVGTPIFVFAQFGLRTVLVSHEKQWPWSIYFWLRVIGVIVGSAALLLYGFVSPEIPFSLVFAILLLKVADSFGDLYAGRLQYFNCMKALGLLSLASAVLTMVSAVLVMWLTNSMVLALIVSSVIAAVKAIVSARYGVNFFYEENSPSAGVSGLLSSGFPVTLSQLFSALLFQIPIFVVGMIANPEAVGVFAVAAYILTFANLFGATLQTVLITPLRLLRKEAGMAAAIQRASGVSWKIVGTGVFMTVPLTYLGPGLIQWVFGPSFAIGWAPVGLLCIASVATLAAYVQSVTLNILNRYFLVTLSIIFSCVVMLLAGLVGYWIGVEAILLGALTAAIGAVVRAVGLSAFTCIATRR